MKEAHDRILTRRQLVHRRIFEHEVTVRQEAGEHLPRVRVEQPRPRVRNRVDAAEESSDLDLLGRLMLRTSARNQLQGQVSGLRREGRHDRVSLALGGGLEIDALITHDSTARLELTLGTTVMALLKAGWVQLLAAQDEAEAGSNVLNATVEEVLADAQGDSEVRLALGNGQTLCAFAEAGWLAGQSVSEGSKVRVQFHPAYVLLGVPV